MRHKDDDREFLPSTGAIREQRRRDYISADGQRFVFALLRRSHRTVNGSHAVLFASQPVGLNWGKRVASPRKLWVWHISASTRRSPRSKPISMRSILAPEAIGKGVGRRFLGLMLDFARNAGGRKR